MTKSKVLDNELNQIKKDLIPFTKWVEDRILYRKIEIIVLSRHYEDNKKKSNVKKYFKKNLENAQIELMELEFTLNELKKMKSS